MRTAIIPACLAALLLLAGCGSNATSRAATGGLGGAAVGTVVGGPVVGTAAGAVTGATLGAATAPLLLAEVVGPITWNLASDRSERYKSHRATAVRS